MQAIHANVTCYPTLESPVVALQLQYNIRRIPYSFRDVKQVCPK